jgi:hypothetical protein
VINFFCKDPIGNAERDLTVLGEEGINRSSLSLPKTSSDEESACGRALYGNGAAASQCSSWHGGQPIHSGSEEPSEWASSSPAAAGGE